MIVQVLFFGATADIAGKRRVEVGLPADSKAVDVLEKIIDDHPGLKAHRLHLSVNQEFASGDETIRDGDELAIFTAVSGG
ncbi:MAG: MoaD/ThiS family protein [Pyrinomonadaceae bacterium]|nr:MoaD/ThiS family protein [Pyrinomonadaceae bacterium]MBP6212167.1 MoaD/ThiS family protein [Pyrinomonadaceae bacterium]